MLEFAMLESMTAASPIHFPRRVLHRGLPRPPPHIIVRMAAQRISLRGILFTALLMLIPAPALRADAPAKPGGSPCDHAPHLDHPHVFLQSGATQLLVFLPDARRGYYRAERFDWSGVIGCAAYRGHTYWGEWFPRYDPLLHDSITGPVEEFRSADGAEGYSAAPPGGNFVKIGVGVLRKVSDAPYRFADSYPIVDTGRWKVRVRKRSIVFQQRLMAPSGFSYLYTKRLVLSRDGSSLRLEHTLRNLGSRKIVTDVYDHDFYMLDGQPTGPGFVLHFPFTPAAESPLQPKAAIRGQDIAYLEQVKPGETVASYLTGFDEHAQGYSLRLENTRLGVGVEQTADRPMSRLYLWSIHTTICPEAYLHLEISPGKSAHYSIAYRFLAPEQ